MGQKVHPYSLRLKINKDWKSKWYFDKKLYSEILHEDFLIRRETMKFFKTIRFDIADIEIIRNNLQRATVVISTPRPGSVIGVKGANIEKIGQLLARRISKKINIKIKEIKKPEFDAQIIANGIAKQMENRASYRKLLKSALSSSISKGIQGIKLKVSGRLGGAEIARSFEVKEGRIPLHTLRANIDYGFAEAQTTYGVIGVKVWVFKGEVLGKQINSDAGQVINRKSLREKNESFSRNRLMDDRNRKVLNENKFSKEKSGLESRLRNNSFGKKDGSDV
ncbi:30S ribosomal protein S3 [Candidatus Borreliella tachyglossi]|uniref:30S ribosomal protein S3 n=1 Tax=Candidatus Borreliella tachyglossi TaxID=1964448 RepID=UPI00404344A3